MRTLFFGGAEVRVKWPMQSLAERGHDVTWFGDQHATSRGFYPDLSRPPDVAIMHWPLYAHAAEVFRQLQEYGILVILSHDDDLDEVPGSHYLRESPQWAAQIENYRMSWSYADAAVVTTPALEAAIRRRFDGPIFQCPNYLPRAVAPRPSKEHATYARSVVWVGTARWHWEDLKWLKPVARGMERDGWHLHLIGDPVSAELLGTGVTLSGGLIDVGELYANLGRFDIGIVPLVDTPFNRSKSWLKGLEYAHAGLPIVARRLPEYEALAERLRIIPNRWGSGVFLVDTPEEMAAQVRVLQDSAEARRATGDANAKIARGLYLEDNLGPWERVLEWAGKEVDARRATRV